MSQQELKLPQGWSESNLDALSLIITKGSTPTSYGFSYQKTGINFIKVENIVDGWIDQKTIHGFINHDANEYLKRSQLKEKDVLFSIAGTIGKTTIVRKRDLPANTNQAIAIIRCPWKYLNPKYIRLILDSPVLFNLFNLKTRGVGIYNLSLTDIKKLTITLPPLNEQKRIVSKIEELFSKIDSTKQSLEHTKLQLEQYRVSLLKSAFEGKLTEEWRCNNSQVIFASIMLEELVENRQKLYEVQLKTAKSKGLRKRKSKFLLEVPTLISNNTLPKSWTVTNIDFLAFVTKLAGFEYTKFFDLKPVGEIPVVKAQNVTMGKFIGKKIEYISKKISDLLPRSQIHGEDILMSFVGSVGNVCLAPNGKRWHLAPNVAKIEVNGINRKYLFYYLQSPLGNLQVHEKKKSTSQASLSMENIRAINVNLPPLEEQEEIVSQIEQGFSLIENTTQIVESSLQNLKTIKMSILKQAFEGKLVPQDPNDEPASVLLERIKSTKESQSTKQRGMKNVK